MEVITSSRSPFFSPLLLRARFFSAADGFFFFPLLECSNGSSSWSASGVVPAAAFLLMTSWKGLGLLAALVLASAAAVTCLVVSSLGLSGSGVGDTGSYRQSSRARSVVTDRLDT